MEDDARLHEFLRGKLGDAVPSLVRMDEVCVSRIYRAMLSGGQQLFVKWGIVPESPAADFLAFAAESPYVPHLVGGSPFSLDGKPVFCFEWIDLHRRRIDQMSDAQFDSFISAYEELSRLMKTYGRAATPSDGVPWAEAIRGYAQAHPVSRLILRDILSLSAADVRLPEGTARTVTHGDFHSGNFSFTGDRLTTFLDFDNFVWGSPVDDYAFAFAESARRSDLAWSPRKRRKLKMRLAVVVRRLGRPIDEWRVAFGRIRQTIAAKTLLRHSKGIRVAFQVASRDRRIRKFAELMNGDMP